MAKTADKTKYNKLISILSDGATMDDLMHSGYKQSMIYHYLNLFAEEGRLQTQELNDNVIHYTLVDVGEVQDEPTHKKKDRKHKLTGVRMTEDENIIHKLLSSKSYSIGELSRQLNRPRGVSKEYVFKVLDSLRNKGFDIAVDEVRKEAVLDKSELTADTTPLELEPLYRHRIRFGVVSDTQLGSKYQQLTLLNTCYEIFDEQKVDFVIHPGDLVDGIKMYRGQDQEIFLHGADDQAQYTVEEYPKRDAYKTYIIAGNHDLVYKKIAGYNVVEAICKVRPDLVYKGDIGCHTFRIKNLTIDVLHPSGGVPYAKSYRIQKVIEGALGDIIDRLRITKDISTIPHIMLLGHLHIMNYTPHIGIDGYIVPCLQSQTPYLKAKGYMPEVGCLVLTIECDDDWNINRVLLDYRKLGSYVKDNDY